MLNLLRSDLFRMTRFRRLRGSFWQYALAEAVLYLLFVGMYFLLISPVVGLPAGERADVVASATTFASPTICVMSIAGGFVPLVVSFMCAELALSDVKGGFVRTLVSSRRGRLSFILGRLLTAGAVAVLMIGVACLLTFLACPVLGGRFTGSDTVAGALSWFAGFWLNCWALGALSLLAVYIVRVSAPAYAVAFCLAQSVVPQLLLVLAAFAEAYHVPGPAVPVLETLATWMPSSAIGALCRGGGVLVTASSDIWSRASSAVTIDPVAQVLLVGVVWIALAGALSLVVARRRDI